MHLRPLKTTLMLLGAVGFAPAMANAQDASADEQWNQTAIHWVNLLSSGDFATAAEGVDPAVADQLTAARLETIWGQVGAQLGALESLEPGTVTPAQGYHVVDLAGAFTNQSLIVRVSLTAERKVSGIFFVAPTGGGLD